MENNNNNAIPKAIARALQHWSCYICDVKRSGILNEGSIKYAISEFLVVAQVPRPENTNSIAPTIIDYKFEFTHPIFVSRTIDLKVNFTTKGQSIESYYEFKYARERNISKDESARYIDDIFRLASLVMNDSSIEAYFLLLGPKQHIENLLLAETNVATIQCIPNKTENTAIYKENIRKMLSLDKKLPSITFTPSDLKPYDEEGQVERFNDDYKK